MLKKEQIWREILNDCFQKKQYVFTQKELAGRLGFSLSTVNNAMALPKRAGAIEITGRNFRVRDREKFLLLWASNRKLENDIIYQTKVSVNSPLDIEGLMPPGVIYGAFSAFVRQYRLTPADYADVYVYADENFLPEIIKRFPLASSDFPNLAILAADPRLKVFGQLTPPVQTFVDLWNLRQWYARDFLESLKGQLGI